MCAVLLLAIVIVAGVLRSKSKPVERVLVPVKVAAVELNSAERGERYSATIIPRTEVELAFKVGGYVDALQQVRGIDGKMRDVQEGDRISVGAVLARAGNLDDSLQELSRAITRDPSLREGRPDNAFEFAPRAVPAASSSASLGLPIPILRPSLQAAHRKPGPVPAGAPAEIPDWFLYYQMALQLEDSGQWAGAVDLLQKGLQSKDRSESLAVVANRLVDYSPHLHLATAYHHLANYREAFLHLGMAKNEGNASPDGLRALNVLVQKDRLRPRIALDPLPDRTTDEAITVHGLVVADDPVLRVEVSGRESQLRPVQASEVADRFPEVERGTAPKDTPAGAAFEVKGYRLAEGTNLLTIRPFFRNPARDGDVLEARIVRLPPQPPAPAPAPEPAAPRPGTKPPRKTTPPAKPPSKPPAKPGGGTS